MILPVPKQLRPLFDTSAPALLRTARNRAWTPHRAQQNLMRIRKKLGIETQYTIPDLRRTNLQRLALAGRPSTTLRAVPGHRSLAALEAYLQRLRSHLLAGPALAGLADEVSEALPHHLRLPSPERANAEAYLPTRAVTPGRRGEGLARCASE
jgi:hypothetical protein